MADVARLAGVSHQTVSRVINAHPRVNPDTRLRVERAIAQLGYRPNSAARSLVTRASRTIGVITVDTANYGPASTLFAIERAARDAGYFVNFVSLHEVGRPQMRQAVDHLMQAGIDALAAIVPLESALDAISDLRVGVPFVKVEVTNLATGDGISVDQVSGARSATSHLITLGHKAIGHIAGPTGWLEADARIHGWRSTLEEAGLPVVQHPRGDWSVDSGYRAARELLPAIRARKLTAIFVANDQMALGVMDAMFEAGLSVPDDISIVGFDDIPESEHFRPRLTTVRQDFGEVGQRCIAFLLAQIGGGRLDVLSPIQPELIVRSSTSASHN